VKLLKRFPYVQSPQAIRGEAVHKELELYARDGVPMSEDHKHHAWVVDGFIKPRRGDKYYEYEFSFDALGNKVPKGDWSKKDFMGTADVLVVNGTKAIVVDYKTGSAAYAKPKQLERMAFCVMWEFPEVTEVMGVLVFLDYKVGDRGEQTVTRQYKRSDLGKIIAAFNAEKSAVLRDHSSGYWEMKPSKLCPWCPVTDCPHYEEKK
jgi:hypothetical protein